MRLALPLFCILIACAPVPSHAAQKSFEITGATIAGTQKAIREGRTTCRTIIESYLQRIETYDQKPIGGVPAELDRDG